MKFLINGLDVGKEKFIDNFLTMRLMQEEEKDLSLILVRSLAELLLNSEQKHKFFMNIGLYEIRRLLRSSGHYVIGNLHFELDGGSVDDITI